MRIGNIVIGRYNRSTQFVEGNFVEIFKKYQDYTMVPQSKFVSILKLIDKYRVDGAYIECGVWKGGLSAAVAERLGNGRPYFLFDSFEGLPEAADVDGVAAATWQNNKDSPAYYNNCAADETYARQAMELAKAKEYELVKGWFQETLPKYRDSLPPIAVLVLDGDWYDSIKVSLENLFELVVGNGLIIIDDYYLWDGCTRAVHEFLHTNRRTERIRSTEEGVCYIIKQ